MSFNEGASAADTVEDLADVRLLLDADHALGSALGMAYRGGTAAARYYPFDRNRYLIFM